MGLYLELVTVVYSRFVGHGEGVIASHRQSDVKLTNCLYLMKHDVRCGHRAGRELFMSHAGVVA